MSEVRYQILEAALDSRLGGGVVVRGELPRVGDHLQLKEGDNWVLYKVTDVLHLIEGGDSAGFNVHVTKRGRQETPL